MVGEEEGVQKNSALLSKQKLFRMSRGCQKDRLTGRKTNRKTNGQKDR